MRFRWYFIVVVLLQLYPSLVWGNEFRLVPSITLKEEYNSNVLLSTSIIKSDFVTSLSAGVEMVNRTDRLDTDLLLGLDQLEYAGNQGLNATNQVYDGKLRYLVSPLFSVSAEAGYRRNTNPTLDIAAIGIVMAAVPWNRINYSMSANYQITEKTAAVVSYSYGRDYYENSKSLDDTFHDVNSGLIYDFSKYIQAVKVRCNMDYGYYYSPDTRIDNVVGTVGFSRDISESWGISVDSGVRHTWAEVSVAAQPAMEQLNNDGWGWVGKVALNYKGERSNGELSYLRDVTPAYGLDGSAERNALTLSTRYRFTYDLSAFFAAGYYTLKSDPSKFSAQVINQQTFRFNPRVRYELSRDVAAEAAYEFTMVDYPALNTDANRHLVSIRLYIQHPFLE